MFCFIRSILAFPPSYVWVSQVIFLFQVLLPKLQKHLSVSHGFYMPRPTHSPWYNGLTLRTGVPKWFVMWHHVDWSVKADVSEKLLSLSSKLSYSEGWRKKKPSCIAKVKVKVKQALYRLGEGLRVLGVWGSQISWKLARGGKVVSPTQWPPLPPWKYSWYSFL
jgi:hypothetical protein